MYVTHSKIAGSAIGVLTLLAVLISGCTKEITDKEYVERAKALQDKGDIRGSVIELKNALEKNPKNPEARWLLGLAYLKAEQGANAEGELKRARELGISEDAIKIPLAEAMLQQGQYQHVLDEVVLVDNESKESRAKLLYIRGSAEAGLGRLATACSLYGEAAAADASYVPSYWRLANCAYASGKRTEARAYIETALKLDPKNPDTWILRGDLEQAEQNFTAADTDYATALKHDPNNVDALFKRASLQMSQGNTKGAEQQLEQMRKAVPKHHLTHYLQALLDYAAGKTDPALEATLITLKARPDTLPGYLLLGILQYDKGSYEQAAKTLNQYLNVFPASQPTRKILAATYLKLKNPNKALDALKPLLAGKSDDAQVLALAAQAHTQLKQPQTATLLYAKAADLQPTNMSLLTELGLSRIQTGNAAEGLQELERAAKGDDKNNQPDMILALYYLRNNQNDKALELLADLRNKMPKDPSVLNMMGVAYAAKRDMGNARQSFEQAQALDPLNRTAAHNLAKLDLDEGKPDSARKRYESILSKDKNNVDAMVELAQLAAQRNQEAEQLSWLEKAAKADEKAIAPKKMLVDYYIAKNEPQKALAIANEAIAANPKLPAALELLGTAQLIAGQKENALTSFKQLTELAPDEAAAHYRLGLAQDALNKVDAARESFKTALAKQADFLPAQQGLVAVAIKTGHTSEALRIAKDIQKQQPRLPLGLTLEGDAYLTAKNYSKAAAAYEQASGLSNTNTLAVKRHQALVLAGDQKAASALLQGWLTSHPDDLFVRAYLARYHLKAGQYKEATAQNEFLLSKAPRDPRILNNLAWLYQEQGDNTRALKTAEQALEIAPDNPQLQDTLGWILVQQGKVERGREILAKAVAKSSDPSVRYHYAAALAKSGDKLGAKKELNAILASGSVFPEKGRVEALLKDL